jgi:hypothetical protein
VIETSETNKTTDKSSLFIKAFYKKGALRDNSDSLDLRPLWVSDEKRPGSTGTVLELAAGTAALRGGQRFSGGKDPGGPMGIESNFGVVTFSGGCGEEDQVGAGA